MVMETFSNPITNAQCCIIPRHYHNNILDVAGLHKLQHIGKQRSIPNAFGTFFNTRGYMFCLCSLSLSLSLSRDIQLQIDEKWRKNILQTSQTVITGSHVSCISETDMSNTSRSLFKNVETSGICDTMGEKRIHVHKWVPYLRLVFG